MNNQLMLLKLDNSQLDYKSISELGNNFIEHFNEIFKYNDKEIKIIGTINDPYFRAKDILEILGYSKYSGTISKILSKLDYEDRKYLSELINKMRS